jgi:hypothetical protein
LLHPPKSAAWAVACSSNLPSMSVLRSPSRPSGRGEVRDKIVKLHGVERFGVDGKAGAVVRVENVERALPNAFGVFPLGPSAPRPSGLSLHEGMSNISSQAACSGQRRLRCHELRSSAPLAGNRPS